MDIKKKLTETKEKYKKYVPTIVAAASVGTTVILVAMNQRLKAELSAHDDRCKFMDGETHLFLTEDSIERLKDGQVALFEPLSSGLNLVLHKDDLHPKTDL